MSLFDLQDVCIAIGSLAILVLPMVVDLIGIYVLKGQYCTLTTTNWFLQALSVILRGSWRDVARRFTMIRWANRSDQIVDRSYDEVTLIGMNRMFIRWTGPAPVDWAVKMRIRPPELETSICDAKYRVSLLKQKHTSSSAMSAHDVRPMSPGLEIMVARWSKRSARLCAAIGAAVRHASRGDARPSRNLVARPAALGAGSVMAAAAVRRNSRQIVATADFSF
ncbi:hypothetical protein F511_26879 [Dorcoceras hygrometricum]|uniref:Uncharacterized protein n=1 Tax=Dorcoceras hygrometricum TaxID=472368 RepID=A0A2Z7A355_9LAMI|nr:hypothetical protein F511_26879 [Dorcoceras hygrometricum]